MRTRAASLFVGFAALVGCASEPVTGPGTAGAGVAAEIVDISHDSTGYTVKFRMTNRDTADVGYGACTGAVEVATGNTWTPVTHWGQCLLWLGALPPETAIVRSIPDQTLTPGSLIRVSLSWDFVYPHGEPVSVSTTAPVFVP